MFLGRTFFLVLTLATAIHGQEEQQAGLEEKPKLSHIVHEEFLPAEDEGNKEHFLRGRELQYSTCQAVRPAPVYVCGYPGSPPSNRCEGSSETCNGLTYDCTCNGVPTACNYCEIRMLGSIACNIAGTSTTVSDTASGLLTCQCMSLGNGQVQQNCFQPTPPEISLPTPPPDSFWALLQPPVLQPTPAPVALTFSLTASNVKTEPVSAPDYAVPVAPPVYYYSNVQSYPQPPKNSGPNNKDRRR